MGIRYSQQKGNDTVWNSDKRLAVAEGQESLYSEMESTQQPSQGHFRRRSPFKKSTPSRKEAAKRLEKARNEIYKEVQERREERKAKVRDTGRGYVQTEGRFQPDGWGYVEKGLCGVRPAANKSNTSIGRRSVSEIIGNPPTGISIPTETETERLLRKCQRFGPHMVPPGKQTPLREVATRHQSANAILRPQSKLSIENAQSDTAEDEQEWVYSDSEDDEIF